MAEFSAKVQGQDRLNRRLQAIRSRAVSARQPLEEIGGLMVRSVRKNFREGGRPKKWAKSKRAGEGRSTLVQSGHLMRSVHAKVEARRVLIGPNRVYGRIHQFGGVIRPKPPRKFLTVPINPVAQGKRARDFQDTFIPRGKRVIMQKTGPNSVRPLFALVRSVRIPARRYLVFQREDRRRAARIFVDWALRGK
jgi:phage virion morphogenesis protein